MGFKFNFGKSLRKLGKAIGQAGPLASLIPGGSMITMAAGLVPAPRARASAPPTPMSNFGGVTPGRFQSTAVPDWQPYPTASAGGGGMMTTMGSMPSIFGAAKRVNWGRIWNAVKVLGIGATAAALNVEVGQLAAELLKHPKKYRKRGVTARQLNNARRVNRIVCGWAKQLQSTAPARRGRCK